MKCLCLSWLLRFTGEVSGEIFVFVEIHHDPPPFFDHEFPEEIAEIKQQIQKTEDATREKVRISMEFLCEVITIMRDFRIIQNLFMDDIYIVYIVYYI